MHSVCVCVCLEVRRLLDSHVLNSCSEVFSAFDESMLYVSPYTANGWTPVGRSVGWLVGCAEMETGKRGVLAVGRLGGLLVGWLVLSIYIYVIILHKLSDDTYRNE